MAFAAVSHECDDGPFSHAVRNANAEPNPQMNVVAAETDLSMLSRLVFLDFLSTSAFLLAFCLLLTMLVLTFPPSCRIGTSNIGVHPMHHPFAFIRFFEMDLRNPAPFPYTSAHAPSALWISLVRLAESIDIFSSMIASISRLSLGLNSDMS